MAVAASGAGLAGSTFFSSALSADIRHRTPNAPAREASRYFARFIAEPSTQKREDPARGKQGTPAPSRQETEESNRQDEPPARAFVKLFFQYRRRRSGF